MKLSLVDMVQLIPSHKGYVNMYEEDDLDRIENGERFYWDDIGLVLESKGDGNYTHFKVLTPRGAVGWIHNFHLELVE
mgnify:FL=1